MCYGILDLILYQYLREVEVMEDQLSEDNSGVTELSYVITELDDNPSDVDDRIENKVVDYYIESGSDDEIASNQGKPKKFKSESFIKTLKTLVDISTEPLVDECYSLSSSDSEGSDSFSLVPVISNLSSKFIKHTTRLFNNSQDDIPDTQPDNDEEFSQENEHEHVNEENGKEWNIEGIVKWF
ncbi:hypothetical protein TpMuguga_04g00221 [Theileria parva strain Muguga]|uniref:Uncharacterized protein n=1 Tax=Theileria parva TaxID=5875 RepID=Q4N2X1_THEPA|nr:uncharacterized protein TpMuguga_04g00221 [Theileria parva strain Muguga]EAN31573.1 hypothetical protein TpMuguga_04g00221 [Theileria parva strain Muguga]|eukprot:XP_763856.1 hypothetical protein [Theileria parva strain Muguga]